LYSIASCAIVLLAGGGEPWVMNKDGDLRSIFRTKFTGWQWSSIETAGTASGVPDSEFCTPEGIQGWVEFKKTHIFYVEVKTFQVSWLMRRTRYGGNAWIAVRRLPLSKRERGVDQLWLMRGNQAERLFEGGLENVYALCWEGGPGNWNYDQIASTLNLKSHML
jgi:hypothetical protein